jgi:hypothetical protein
MAKQRPPMHAPPQFTGSSQIVQLPLPADSVFDSAHFRADHADSRAVQVYRAVARFVKSSGSTGQPAKPAGTRHLRGRATVNWEDSHPANPQNGELSPQRADSEGWPAGAFAPRVNLAAARFDAAAPGKSNTAVGCDNRNVGSVRQAPSDDLGQVGEAGRPSQARYRGRIPNVARHPSRGGRWRSRRLFRG